MTKLLLVRHGETEWNSSRLFQGQQDIDLNDSGVRQAELLSERLAGEKITAAYTSDLQRAHRTASIALKYHPFEAVPDARLREITFGLFEGLNNVEIANRYPAEWKKWNDDWVNVPPPGGGENLRDLAARMQKFLEDIKQNHSDDTVLVVSHSGPLRALLCIILHIDLSLFWQHRLDNASITVVDSYGDRAIVSLLNDTCHLKGA